MINSLLDIVKTAGNIVLAIYEQPSFQVANKADQSPLTEADAASHLYICEALKKIFPSIPVLSEESAGREYAARKNWEYFFLVDPLDGSKEFIQRNGEFTINIALVKNKRPILGIIHAPVLDVTYYAEDNKGANKIANNKIEPLRQSTNLTDKMTIVTSRSHLCSRTEAWISKLAAEGKQISKLEIGSALKFGLIAEGWADVYPRLSPTMEWDTAAGQVIVNEVGKQLRVIGSNEILTYNKPELVNPGFVVR